MRVNPVTIAPNKIVVYELGIRLEPQLLPFPEFYPAEEPDDG